jgi:ATP-dependent DNA helicase RecG
MREAGNPDPVFDSSRGLFTVTLYKRAAFEETAPIQNKDLSDIGHSILEFCKVPRTRVEIAAHFRFKSVSYFSTKHVILLVERNLLVMGNPDHPKSTNQTYTTASLVR